jgi:hypothetical protein
VQNLINPQNMVIKIFEKKFHNYSKVISFW